MDRKDIGDLLGELSINIFVSDNMQSFFKNLDVVIEFGLEEATIKFVKAIKEMLLLFLEVQAYQLKLLNY